MCITNGGILQPMPLNGTGGTLICSNDSAVLPNISDTGLIYCGTGCAQFVTDNNNYYGFGAYGDGSYIVCGQNYNFNGWWGVSPGASWNFAGTSGCATYGF